MESQIKIRATVPEMNTFFEEESGVRYMEIRDRRHSSDEIERMPESKFNSKVFMWAVRLRHPKVGKELTDYEAGMRSGYLQAQSDHAGLFKYKKALAEGKTKAEAKKISRQKGKK